MTGRSALAAGTCLLLVACNAILGAEEPVDQPGGPGRREGGTDEGGAPGSQSCAGSVRCNGESCCASLLVNGGSFKRDNDSRFAANVNDLLLDKYPITVGRFRAFVDAGMGTQASPPLAGSGTTASVPGSGWDSSWNTYLVAPGGLPAAVQCDPIYQTWTGGADDLPMNCITWYEAFAFCIWDGGRLPTELEYNYAMAGGGEQRAYPWSVPPASRLIDPSYAVYATTAPAAVGSRSPKGDGKWGQADLAGNVWEWNLDWYADYAATCYDCANVTSSASSRVIRGGCYYYDAAALLSSYRSLYYPTSRSGTGGARCARSP